MPGLMEVFILKERVNDNRDDSIFMMLFEKAFILISLLFFPCFLFTSMFCCFFAGRM